MNRRILILGSFAVILLLAVVWSWDRTIPPPYTPMAVATISTPAPTSPSTNQLGPGSYPWQGNTYAPLPASDRRPGYDPSLPQWEEWRRRRSTDPKFEWKMPINFYGRVIDQNGQPVQGAKVRLQWTDMSAAGTTEKFTETDVQGMFSLTNEKGKRLSVFVAKDGYRAVKRGRASFEYAAFFEPNYIEPDPNNPVIFELIEKARGRTSDKDGTGNKTSTGWLCGQGAVEWSCFVRSAASRNQVKPDQPWAMQVAVKGGGLQCAVDEFPVETPTAGYQSSVTIDRKSPKPSGWSGLYQGGVLYVKTTQGYGRVEIRMLAGDNKARVTTYLNPSGSRNLEPR